MMLVSCPECKKKLRLSQPPAAGKRIRCPQCAAAFVAAAEEEDNEAPSEKVARVARKDAPARDQEEDDAERDRPRARRRQVVEENDDQDRPTRGKRATRVRADDEDDENDRPRRRKQRKQGSSALLWVGIAGGGVVVLAVAAVVVVLLVRGGSNYSQHEAVAQEVIGLVKELATTLESVQDPNSARAAAVRINSICDRMEAAHNRSRSLGKLTVEENRRLQEKVNAELMPLTQRMTQVALQAGVRAQGEPTFMAAAKRLSNLRNLAN